jgi:hypothetical protein
MTERFPTEHELKIAWDEYLAAYHRAHQTQDLDDGIAAAKLWRRWLRRFERMNYHESGPNDNVIYVGYFGGILRGKEALK